MSNESNVSREGVNPLPDTDFDLRDPNGWYRYVADSLVLTGLARRSGETYAREIRILVQRFQRILYRGLRFLFNSIKTPHIYAYLRTVYSCGLRLSEALHIRPGDIDRAGGRLHIRQGKGSKDRKVVLPPLTLEMLGRYWLRHRNPRWLFPALGKDGKGGPTAEQPMSITAVQGGLRRHLKRAGITKSRVTIHTLRHSYATHLLEAGVPLTVLQQQLGHEKIETTLRYVHLSKEAQVDSVGIIGRLMGAIR